MVPRRRSIGPATELVARVSSRRLLADKAYDAGHLRDALGKQGCVAVIPSKQGALGDRVHVQFAQAGTPLRDTLREDAPELRSSSRHRMRAALASDRKRYSSQACANLISIATTRTSIDLPAFWPASSRRSSLRQTSSRAADSVAEPRAVR